MVFADPTSPVFEPDPRHLLRWAYQHEACCRKISRKLLAFVSVWHVDRAWRSGIDAVDAYIASYPPNGYPPKPEWLKCIRELHDALREHQELSASDYSRWHAAHATPKPVNAIDLFFHYFQSESRDTKLDVIKRVKQYEASPYVALIWPTESDNTLPLKERTLRCLEVEESKYFETKRKYELLSTFNLYDEGNRRSVTTTSEVATLIFDDQWPRVERLVRKLVRDHPSRSGAYDRDDLLQIARIAIWQAIPRFRGGSQFTTYVYSVVRRALIDHWRQMQAGLKAEPFTEEARVGDGGDPSTTIGARDEVIEALRRTPNAELLLLRAAGFRDEDLGTRTTIRQRRKRAADRARRRLAMYRQSPGLVA